ncbi:MAG: hypothetical protein R3Y06_05295 [Faecalibacterium sp.]
MKLLQYLKALADISFLYASFGTLCLMLFSSNSAFAPLFIFPLVVPCAYPLRGKKYRFLAVCPALFVLLFVQSPADIIMPCIVLWYLFLVVKHEQYTYLSYHEIDRFRWQIIALPILVLLCMLFGLSAMLAQYTLPCTLLYLLSANLFLRLNRADEKTLASPRFLMVHLLSLGGLLVAAAVLSSEQLRSAVVQVIQFIYLHCVVPLFTAVAMAVFWVIMLVIRVIIWLFGGAEVEEIAALEADYSVMQGLTEESTLNENVIPTWLSSFATLVMVVVVVAVVWYVIRKMLSGIKKTSQMDGITITQQKITPEAVEKRGFLFRSPRQKVRAEYRAFMRHAKAHGIVISSSIDTTQLEQKVGCTKATTTLTALYRHARYDETRAIAPEQAAAARAARKKIQAGEKTNPPRL